ncbi:MAG: NUDIX domain-containing protein [Cytophagaceae bacterium]|nr:NUDIX domain-containing protein [Cytophagaceae bacterium]MDW8456470.1 NUDIX domain-containing protein [Cytophagaceae bacterium]
METKKGYENYDKVHVAIDCVIFGYYERQLQVLLIQRDFEPVVGEWSLIGGILSEDEDLDAASQRILKYNTGLDNVFMEHVHVFGKVHRDPLARVVSVMYYALINPIDYNHKLIPRMGAKWFPINNIPKLIFDHEEMLKMAFDTLKKKITRMPIGFELLPPKFTMPELIQLYEAILQKSLDKRNLSKKIFSLKILRKHNEKQFNTSKKGAFLYSFDKRKYEALTKKGFLFEI